MRSAKNVWLAAACCALVAWAACPTRAAEQRTLVCRYCGQAEGRAPGEKSAAATVRHYAPDRRADILHICLDVTPDFDHHTITGTATLTFQPIAKPLRELKLDAVDLQILQVHSEQPIEDFSSGKDDLTIFFRKPIPLGTSAQVAIEYQAEPARGLYFRTPKNGYPAADMQVWSQGEPYEARHWFPCFDAPNERASTELICHVPAAMTVLSNGRRLGEKIDPRSGLKMVHWLQAKPHASYLICLVAGHLSTLKGHYRDIPLGFHTQPSLAPYAESSFRDTAPIMAFYEQEIGVPFPWDKYDQVTILDFMWGGMENTSLTALTERTLFSPETENIRTTRRLNAHEMAHQWFGDYVTCKDWSHLWLNEGFATYYTHLYEGHKFGLDALRYGLYRDAREKIWTQAADTRPIVTRTYKKPHDQFDFRAYPKGSWVLHMLRSQLGEGLYRRSIQTYLQRHALGFVETEDLRAVLEELSGRPLDRFFDQWVYNDGFPELKVESRWLAKEKLVRVTVEQTQATNDKVLLFQFPAAIRLVVGGTAHEHPIEIRKKKHDFYFALAAKPEIVRFDPEYTLLAKVKFKKPDAMLFAQLKRPDDLLGRLLAIEALSQRKTRASVKALQAALRGDPFYGTRREAAAALQAIGTEEALAALEKGLEQTDARVRLAVVEAIGSFYSEHGQQLLSRVARAEKNPAIVGAALQGLGKYPGPATDQILRSFLHSDSFRNELAVAAVKAIASRRSPDFVADLMKLLEQREHDLTSQGLGQTFTALAASARDRPAAAEVRNRLLTYLQHPRPSIRAAAAHSLGDLGDPGARAALEDLAAPQRSDRLAEAARAALKVLNRRQPAAPKELSQFREQLSSLREQQQKLQQELTRLKSKEEARADQTGDEAKETTPPGQH